MKKYFRLFLKKIKNSQKKLAIFLKAMTQEEAPYLKSNKIKNQ